MIFRIPSGKHYARPRRFGIYWNRKSFSWKVKFTDSCRYDLRSGDQLDTNKLCGIGYFPGFHHIDSARFGWRYNIETGLIELMAYCYVNKQRIIKPLASCEIGKEYHISLKKISIIYLFDCAVSEGGVYLKSIGSTDVPYYHKKKLGYRLPVYFGGNHVAPHEIKIELEKL
jgi:hypothetical protein